jgi:hypothetical protein
LKSGAYLSDALLSPKLAFSQEPGEAPFNVAFNTDVWFYPWYDIKGHEYRQTRFNQAMNGFKIAAGANAILEGIRCVINDSNTLASLQLSSLLQALTGRVSKRALSSWMWAAELAASAWLWLGTLLISALYWKTGNLC